GNDYGGVSSFNLPGSECTLGTYGHPTHARKSEVGGDVGNDFGLIQITGPDCAPYERTSMPVWGGPTTTGDVTPGRQICYYGTGSETYATMARDDLVGIGISGT